MLYDAQRDVVIYNKIDPEPILKHIPDARQLCNGYLAVPASLFNLQVLRFLGHSTIPPMKGKYDWPRSPFIQQPFNSQIVTSNFLALTPRSLVLSDMGTGKTLAALWASDFVMNLHPGTRCLIVAPLSTLQQVWADAIFSNFMGKRSCVVLHGSAEKRRKLLAEPHDFYIINHDGVGVGASYRKGKFEFKGFSHDLLERSDIRMAIVDEISAYRDGTTRRSRVARHILGRRDYFWGLTGTPTPNGPTDAYGIAKLVNNAFGESFVSYRQRVMTKISQFKWVPKPDAHLEARKLLSPSIRFSLEDCVDLPPITVQTRDVEMSDEQIKAWSDLKRELRLILDSGSNLTVANEAVLRAKLIQVSCGAIYDSEHRAHLVDYRPRLGVLREVIDECGGKIIVFAPLTSVVNMLHHALRKDYSVAVVTGAVGRVERGEIFRRFQQERAPRVLVADPGTMAHGLNLEAAATICWYGPTDRTETYLQANRRIRRPGQRQSQTIVQLASNKIEREIFRRLAANESLQGIVLQLVREGE